MRMTLEEPSEKDSVGGPGTGLAMAVELVDAGAFLTEAGRAWLIDHARRAAAALGVAGRLSVRVVDDSRMAEAHERYAGVAGTTDVLTFDLTESPGAPLEVDLLVCGDEAERQASARGHEAGRELLLYVLHGLLHCLGHDDHDEAAAARMHDEEDRVLRAIGVGATFSREAAP